MRTLAFLACVAGCSDGTGSLELTLSLPTQAGLRPTGMTTVTVSATAPGDLPSSTTSVITNNQFAAGDLPVGTDVQIGVVLRDVSNRIVGVGEAGQTIDIVGDKPTSISIPVRRPFVYASSGTALYSFDPTLDPRDAAFQGRVMGVTNPQLTITVGGDRLAVITATHVEVIVTATNTVSGSIPVPAGVRDAAAVPGTHKLAIAHATGITIVDLDAATTTTAAVGPVDRVTVGPNATGAMVAYGLIARTAPPDLPPPLGTCGGTSSMVAISVDAPEAAAPVSLGAAVSDLAAAPGEPMLFATLPCTGQVAKVMGAVEGSAPTVVDFAALERAAVLTVAGGRVWAAGTTTAMTKCSGGAMCNAATQVACPAVVSNTLVYADTDARIVVQSIPLDGDGPIVLEVPGRRETIIDLNDDAFQHAQVLKALTAVPVDLVALPGGQYVGLVTRSRYYIAALANGSGPVLPCLDATTSDWMLIDFASSSVAQRVRTFCDVIVGSSMMFPNWGCDLPPEGERLMMLTPEYRAISVGALFGAR